MDFHFVPNMTIGPLVIEAVRRATTLPLDVHLMIEDAERWVPAYAHAGADLIGVHVEACPHLHRTLHQIRDLGKRASVVLNPATPPEAIEWVLGDVDQVLVMSVNPGFGGQAFIASALDKIRRLRRMIEQRGLAVDIEVDGGVKLDNVAAVCAAGASAPSGARRATTGASNWRWSWASRGTSAGFCRHLASGCRRSTPSPEHGASSTMRS